MVFHVMNLVYAASIRVLIIYFINYFQRVALLASIASLPSGPVLNKQTHKTMVHIKTINIMYMCKWHSLRGEDAIKHISDV